MKLKILALVASVLMSSASQADLISYSFEGNVSEITLFDDTDFTPLELTDTISGTITFDLDVAPIFSDETTIYWLDSAVAISISTGDFSVALNTSPTEGGITQVLATNAAGLSAFQTLQPVTSNTVDNWTGVQFAFVAIDVDGTAVTDLAYPTLFSEFDSFESSITFNNINSDSASIKFTITSVDVAPVPLPGAFWLYFTAVSLFGFKRLKAS